jgi:hypothetical protein
MRVLRQAGSDPAFLLKALGEAAGELREQLGGLRRQQLLLPGSGNDEQWTLLGLACHVRDVELGVNEQFEAILRRRTAEPDIPHVDIDAIPFLEEYEDEDLDEVLGEFAYYRRSTSYTLWDISEWDWDRAGIHPYRGRMTVADIVRELYQHDLEHLWQARRMASALVASSRR